MVHSAEQLLLATTPLSNENSAVHTQAPTLFCGVLSGLSGHPIPSIGEWPSSSSSPNAPAAWHGI